MGRTQRQRAALAAIVAAVLLASTPVDAPHASAWTASAADAGHTAPVSDSDPTAELRAEAEATGDARVMVRVEGADPAAQVSAVLDGTEHAIGQTVDDVVAVTVTAEGVDRLATAPEVTALVEDAVLRPHLDASTARIGADVAGVHGWTGSERTIALIDTGIDVTHPAFAGAIDTDREACFLGEALCPNGLVEQFGPGAAAPCAHPDCIHGSHVASIAAGRDGGDASAGVAPGATIIPIRIFHFDGSEVVSSTSDLLAALEYVRQVHLGGTEIDVVNLSLGDQMSHWGACDEVYDGTVADKVGQLRALGIAVVASTGNAGASRGVTFPACVSAAIPVTATDRAADTVWPNANSGAVVSLAAPGTEIRAATGASGTEVLSGTSMAAPHVTGAIAVLRQRYGRQSVSWFEERLWETGAALTDTRSGLQLRRIDLAAATGVRAAPPVPPTDVAWSVTDRGRVLPRGAAGHWGDATLAPGESIVAGTATRSGMGYWLASDRGRVFAFGDALHLGDMAGRHLNAPVTAMTTTRSGRGYWLLAEDGGIFTFGDARFHGSTGDMQLNAPVTDLARTRTGAGYWLTAMDGGVFSFGDARFHGSTGGMRINQPVVSIAAGPTAGYWLVALDGGVFSFGAPFHGSLPGAGVSSSTSIRVRPTAGGRGYYIATREGGLHRFGLTVASPSAQGLRPGEVVVDLFLAGA